jgi:hypothetical protein
VTLNRTVAQPIPSATRRRLEGTDRAIDVSVGLVIFIVEILIGYLVLDALYQVALTLGNSTAAFGFTVAVFGAGLGFLVTTLTYLVRLARGRRSWGAPLWGLIFIAAASVVGYLVITGSL